MDTIEISLTQLHDYLDRIGDVFDGSRTFGNYHQWNESRKGYPVPFGVMSVSLGDQYPYART
jgi:hypothetical protein